MSTECIIEIVTAQVRRLSRHLVEALYLSAERRVLRRLEEIARVYWAGQGPVTIPLTQEHLAEIAGTSRATVNRVLREAAGRGTVELGRGRTIVRPEAEDRRSVLPRR